MSKKEGFNDINIKKTNSGAEDFKEGKMQYKVTSAD
jgi:hypothetical protein